MNRAILSVIQTIIFGLAGIYLGAALNLDGYLGIIIAIAVTGFHIIRAIEDGK